MATVHVSNIHSGTSEKEVRDFFSYCGKITQLSLKPASSDEKSTLSATITFERESAAETARLLDNTQLGQNAVKVEGTASMGELLKGHEASGDSEENHELRQEDKPRTAVLAEYLSRGYIVGEQALQKGIELDNKHGVSNKFMSYLQAVENKVHPVGTARSVDQTYGVTDKAAQGVSVLQQYFENAMGTPTGKKIRSFYMQGQKQVLDIHNEARRLADLRKQEAGGTSGACNCKTAGECKCNNAGSCSCSAGSCTCADCETHNNTSKSGSGSCSCKGTSECSCKNSGNCQCKPGACTCKDCETHSTRSGEAGSSSGEKA